MLQQAIPYLFVQRNIIILCNNWYAKKALLCVVNKYADLDVICNAMYDSIIYDSLRAGGADAPNMRNTFPWKESSIFSMKG